MAPKKSNSVQKVSKENAPFLRGVGNVKKWLFGESDFSGSGPEGSQNPYKGNTGADDVEAMRARGRASARETFKAQAERQAFHGNPDADDE